jgi:outer membrane protein TolC
VDLSREDLRVSQERYRLGLATILDLQSAQITLLEAEVNLIRAQFDYQLGLARLEALLGTDLR